MIIERKTVRNLALGVCALELAACSSPSYEVKGVTQEEVQKQLAQSFSLMRGHAVTDFGKSEEEIEKRRSRMEAFDSAILSDSLTRQVSFQHKGYAAQFFVDDGFEVPSYQELVQMWDFIEGRSSLLVEDVFLGARTKRFNPVSRANFFVGNFGIDSGMQSFTVVRRLDKADADAMVNMDNAIVISADPFWTEYCQTLLIGAIGAARDQEVICNEVGIAAYAAKRGFTYEEYKEIADRTGFVPGYEGPREITLHAYAEETYQTVVNIFTQDESQRSYLSEIEQYTKGNKTNKVYYSEQASKYGAKL